MTPSTGNFGLYAKEYDALRPKYPSKVISTVVSCIPNKNPLVLDLGCGTGIGTRQIANRIKGSIIGCDVDEVMLATAISYRTKNTAYALGEASKLPFQDKTFDMVTSFTSFHWFCDAKSIKEIKRVLKDGGVLCIVQPRHTAPFAGDLRVMLEKELGKSLPPKYKKADFQTLLIKGGFDITQRQTFKDSHNYTLNQYLTLIQSYSVWNEVPSSEQKQMLEILKNHFATKLKQGFIHDTRDIEVTIAKPNT